MTGWDDASRRAVGRAREVFRLSGRDDLGRWLDTLLETSDSVTPVVSLGEVKTGKSSLLNALLGVDLLPVGVDVTTGAFIRVVPGDLPSAVIHEGAERRPVTVEQALRAATVGGGARGVDIVHPARWLPGLDLVDTPGLGGLDGDHARIALRQAEGAGVLLVVLDAGTVLSRPELDAIAGVVERVPELVVALARTDRNPAGWRQVLAEDRAILEGAGVRAPIVPVSSVLAQEAGSAEAGGDPDTAQMLWEASGIPVLAAALTAAAGRAADWPRRNALHSALTGLDRVRDQLAAERAALDGHGHREDEFTGRRDQLRELSDHNARWPLDLQRDLTRLKQDTAVTIGRRLDELQEVLARDLPAEPGRWSNARIEEASARVDAALRVAADDLVEDFHARLFALVNRMFAAFDAAFDLRPFVPPAPEGRGPRPVPPRRTPVVDPSVVSIAMIGAGLAPQFGSLVGIATGVGLFHPAGLLFAGALVALNIGFRQARAGRQQVVDLVLEAVRHLRSDLLAYADAVITEATPEIRVAYAAEVRRAIDGINAQLAALDQARRADADQLRTDQQALDKRLDVVARVRAEVAAQLGDRDAADNHAPDREQSVMTPTPKAE